MAKRASGPATPVPEIEQHDLVEAAQEGDQLAVAVGREARGELGIARCAEHVQPARQPRDERAEFGRAVEPIRFVEQVGER